MILDLSEFEAKKNAGSSGERKIIFVNGKACAAGLTFRPYGTKAAKSVTVFDETTKRSRLPQSGEKPTVKWMIPGLDENRQPRVYSCPASVISEIIKVRDTLETHDVYVSVTTSGTGLNTTYNVAKNKKISGKLSAEEEAALKALDLEAVRDSLVAPRDEAAAAPAAQAATVDADDMAWAK
jgi:hypothetical protein